MAEADPRDRFFDTEHLDEELEGRAARGGRIIAITQVVRSLLDVASTLVLVRVLSPDDFGVVGMVSAVIGFIALFKDLGLTTATIQRPTITHREVTALMWINVGLSVLLGVMVAALSPALAWFYEEPKLVEITLALSTVFFVSGFGAQHHAILRRQMRFGTVSLIDAVSLSIGMIVAVIAAFMGAGYWSLVLRRVVTASLTTIFVWLGCSWRPSAPRREKHLKELVAFGANLTGFSLINYFARNLDDVLIGRFDGATAVERARTLGNYQKAYELLMLPLRQLNKPVSAVAVPALSRLYSQPERYRRVYLRIMRLVLMVTMPLTAFLVMTAGPLVEVVFGAQWREAVPIFEVLGIAAFTQPIGNSTGWLFISQDRTGEMLRWGVLGASLAVLSFVIGLPWGAFGIAAAYSLGGIFLRTPILLWWVGRSGPVKTVDFYRMAAPYLVSGLAAAAALFAFRPLAETLHPVVALVGSAVIALVAAILSLSVSAQGRASLADARLVLSRRLGKGSDRALPAIVAEAESPGDAEVEDDADADVEDDAVAESDADASESDEDPEPESVP
jgi:PST family polysaccharide transporter